MSNSTWITLDSPLAGIWLLIIADRFSTLLADFKSEMPCGKPIEELTLMWPWRTGMSQTVRWLAE
jgi:hypothetical protein